jgi:EmrB/QacA subfamily drug resistance transporter
MNIDARTGTSPANTQDAMKKAALLVAVLASFLTPFMVSSINIALPAIGKEFALNAVLLSWVPTSYLLAAAMFLVPFGRLADIYGRKKIFTYGIILYTASSLLLAAASSAAFLIVFRVLQGIGSAMIFSTGMAILTSVYPVTERGRVLGITVAAVYLGLSLGPFFGGFLTQHFGWRSIFIVNVPIGMAVMAAVFWKLKGEWAEARGERFDWSGAVIYSLALIAIVYGLSLLPAAAGAWLIIVGTVGIVAFVRWEMKATSPLLTMDLFRNNAAFTFSNLAALVNYSATFAVTFLLSLYLQYIKGFTPQHAGMILVAQPLVMTIFSPFAGRLSDKIEPRVVASLGMGFTAGGLVLFTFLDAGTHRGLIIAGLVLLGFGFALFSSPNTNAVMSSIDRKFYGVASAMLGTMRLTGQMMSMGIAMLIFALHIGNARITPEYYPLFLQSVRTAFTVFAVLCFGGIFASLARGKMR